MAFEDEKDGERRRKSDQDRVTDKGGATAQKKRPAAPEVGNALRSAYQQTVHEDIPPEMLDLLGKLS